MLRRAVDTPFGYPSPMRIVTAGIIFNNGKLLIGKRRNEGNLPGLWELPGGKCDRGETPQKALARELMEELGIVVEVGEIYNTVHHKWESGEFELQAYFVKTDTLPGPDTWHDEIRYIEKRELNDYEYCPSDVKIIETLETDWEKYN